ncbi:OR2B6 protein, partial [Polypterus senegalus]|nr:OR2B6 protein [Polypterus senegalus]
MSSVQQFIVVGLPGFQDHESKLLFSVIFLIAYLLICLGNLSIIVTFILDESLHKPMYALICTLAVFDICYSSATVPRALAVLMFDSMVISFAACFAQIYIFHAVGSSQAFLFMLMAYDRFVAICNPLLYLALRLPFCGPNKVMHLYCDHTSVVRLACADISVNSIVTLTIGLSVIFIPLAYNLYSYIRIITSVLKIASSEGRTKAFSTCGSHLVVIFIASFTAAGVYISYRIPGTSEDMRILAAVLHTIIPPLLNPVIYCLRNKEIRDSFVKTVKRCIISP